MTAMQSSTGLLSQCHVKRRKVDLADLITGGALQPGMPLYPRRKKHSDKRTTLLPDGTIEVDGTAFSSATERPSRLLESGRTGGGSL